MALDKAKALKAFKADKALNHQSFKKKVLALIELLTYHHIIVTLLKLNLQWTEIDCKYFGLLRN